MVPTLHISKENAVFKAVKLCWFYINERQWQCLLRAVANTYTQLSSTGFFIIASAGVDWDDFPLQFFPSKFCRNSNMHKLCITDMYLTMYTCVCILLCKHVGHLETHIWATERHTLNSLTRHKRTLPHVVYPQLWCLDFDMIPKLEKCGRHRAWRQIEHHETEKSKDMKIIL